ncbi:carbohydrate-binding module family 1 protein [Annulohypoxylon maeteangense]|uniref:carbohydrate-binding module family 1 protein n=1 Tax=Annulohypoxylon maeteangense TaxID=1927788 RepID=UPI0020079156|nr:carbohydrate-binding module family 1 protein [Annulohypoxylon maeteangense]KAI0889629.1 carbohydrate-binding module family 1 protein [Annulohypoxylon maeteangense]
MAKIWGFAATLVVLSSVVSVVQAQNYPLVTDSRCNCYRTNTTTSHYFTHHRFFDFRDMSQYVRIPAPINDPQAATAAPVTNNYFNDPAWTSVWSIQNWNNSLLMNGSSDVTGSDATVLMVNSANNIYFDKNQDKGAESKTYMVMRTMRHDKFQSASEIESISLGYRYISIRMYARTKGAPGAVTAMFTFREAAQLSLVQEADLEIRTVDPTNSIQYTNQPSWNETGDIPQATRNVSMPNHGDWSDWQYHRMDWTPGSTSWFVDGQLMSSIQFQAPRDASRIMFNSWSDGGSWSGNMSVNASAEMQIQWIDIVYNSTDPVPGNPFLNPGAGGACANTCSIDLTSKTGTPVLISGPSGNNPAPGNGNSPGACTAAKWGQCAGKTWSGCTACAAGTSCKFQNDYYSQCL